MCDFARRGGSSYGHYPIRWRVAHGYFFGTVVLNPSGPTGTSALLRLKMPFGNSQASGDRATALRSGPPAEQKSNSQDLPGQRQADARRSARKPPLPIPSPIRERTHRGVEPQREIYLHRVSKLEVFKRTQWEYLRLRDRSHVLPMHHDMLPLSDRSVRFFLLVPPEMVVWQYDFVPETESEWSWIGDWQRKEFFLVDFSEPFHVAENNGNYFFVTASGTVYIARKGKEGERKVETLWKKASRPVIALLVDVDTSRTFAFARDYRFQLTAKFKPQRGPEVAHLGRPDLAQPMRTVFECAKVLYRAGELTEARDQ